MMENAEKILESLFNSSPSFRVEYALQDYPTMKMEWEEKRIYGGKKYRLELACAKGPSGDKIPRLVQGMWKARFFIEGISFNEKESQKILLKVTKTLQERLEKMAWEFKVFLPFP